MKINTLIHWGQRQHRRTTDRMPQVTSHIGAGSVFRGNLTGRGYYLVCGLVEGDAELDGHVLIAEGGQWTGRIHASHVLIVGELRGDITATARIELGASARVRGNLASPVIAISERAVHDGSISRPPGTRVIRYPERRGRAARTGPWGLALTSS